MTDTQRGAFTFLYLLVISNWIECSALPVHTRTLLNMICILISQMKLHPMKIIDTDGGGFEGSPRLERRHGGFAVCTVSPCYYSASQSGLYPSISFAGNLTSYDETTLEIQVHRWITLHQLDNDARLVSGCDRLSSRTARLTGRRTYSVHRGGTCVTLVLPDMVGMSWLCLNPHRRQCVGLCLNTRSL